MRASDAPPEQSDVVSVNAVSVNAVSVNAIQVSALLSSPLTQSSLIATQQPGGPLEDPSARQLFSYVVSCALPKGAELTYTDAQGNAYTFDGDLGVAQEWGKRGGKCNETCRQWVSGCVLSRVDYLGQHVNISIRGVNPALKATPQERHDYPHREATYFGNIFSQPQRLFACLSPGQTSDPRVCGPSLDSCGIQFLGSCDEICSGPTADGAFTNCRGPSDEDDEDEGEDRAYKGSVTAFLQ